MHKSKSLNLWPQFLPLQRGTVAGKLGFGEMPISDRDCPHVPGAAYLSGANLRAWGLLEKTLRPVTHARACDSSCTYCYQNNDCVLHGGGGGRAFPLYLKCQSPCET